MKTPALQLIDIHSVLFNMEEQYMTTAEYQIWQIVNGREPRPVPQECKNNSDIILEQGG